jgi:hypothetical protein
MTPTEKGAFCNKCAKVVHDFSNKSSDEILTVLKLNSGGEVCGRLKPEQIIELNNDFQIWNTNNKQSFQSALIFSLIVVFGMTLFGCEEEEQEQKISDIQTIGMALMKTDSELRSRTVTLNKASIEALNDLAVDAKMIEIQDDEVLKVVERNPDVQKEFFEGELFPESLMQVTIDGGIGYSHGYEDYLEDVMSTVTKPTQIQVDAPVIFKAFAFPNPATDKTTLKIEMPQKEMAQIKLFSLAGQFIKNVNSDRLEAGESNLEIDLIDLPKGTYIISIVSESYHASVKFIKL